MEPGCSCRRERTNGREGHKAGEWSLEMRLGRRQGGWEEGHKAGEWSLEMRLGRRQGGWEEGHKAGEWSLEMRLGRRQGGWEEGENWRVEPGNEAGTKARGVGGGRELESGAWK